MKKYTRLYPFLALLSLAACSKHDQPLPQPAPVITIKDISDPINFKVIPLAPDQLRVDFYYPAGRTLKQLYMKAGADTIAVYPISVNGANTFYTTRINYAFKTGQSYDFIVLTNESQDTIYRYRISGYTHTYASYYNYQKFLDIYQSLGPQGYDISPSHQTIYITDVPPAQIVNGTVILNLKLNRVSLSDLHVDTVATGNISALRIRAISDDEVLVQSNLPAYRTLNNDSAALVRFNTKTGQSTFLDWISANYSRTSRVVGNHVLITNPYFAGAHSTLFDLGNNSKVAIYPYGLFPFLNIREDNYDHLYDGNSLVDPVSGAILPSVTSDSSFIEYSDEASGYRVETEYVRNSRTDISSYSSVLAVYKNGAKIYQGDTASGRTFQIGRLLRFDGGKLIFYQYFGYSTGFRIDGYYSLDLQTGQLTLLQCDSNSTFTDDFQLDSRTVVAVRGDGLYKLTAK